MADGEIVLAVDDNQAVRRFIEGVLRPAGFKVETAGDGVEALQRILKGPVDLILLDFVMPRMNGYHFCKALDEKGLALDVPIVLLSSADERVAEKMKEHTRVVDFLAKPVKAKALLQVVQRNIRTADADEAVAVEGSVDSAFDDCFAMDSSDDGLSAPEDIYASLRDKIQNAVADGLAERLDDIAAATDREEMLGIIAETLGAVVDDDLLEALLKLIRSTPA